MTQLADMKALEKETFRKFYDDGLFDVFLGVMLGLMLLDFESWFSNEAARIGGLIGIYGGLVTGVILLRTRLLRSRLGEFKPGPHRRRRINVVLLVLVGSVILGLVAWAGTAAGSVDDFSIGDPDFFMPLLWLANAVIVFSAMAHFLDVPRFHAYGFLFGSALLLRTWPRVFWDLELPRWVAFGAPAAVIVGVGLLKLRSFLRDYPVADRQEPELGF